MCGIAGFSGNFDEIILKRMNAVIAHRGPDDFGKCWLRTEQIGFAHRRLSIIDLSSHGHQPMWDKSNTALIVFNGEIYNYQELRDDLIRDGFSFNSHSDTEVLLNLYLRDGTSMFSAINGIFAFAIFDKRNKEMFVARDGVGVKPLYYSEASGGFIFASEIKAILQELSVSRVINPKAVVNHLAYLWSPAPDTILEDVRKLEPGHALIVKKGRIEKKYKFYDLPYGQPIHSCSIKQAEEKTQYYLKQAVSRQLISDVPVGAFLSGGLDSSAVVALAMEAQPDTRIQCFTIGLHGSGMDEEGVVNDLPYAKRVAEYLNVDLHVVNVGPEMILDLEKMIYHLDEPQADPAPLNVMYISQFAREHGIKVLLSGVGGDDIFTGYRRHYALMQEKHWAWLPGYVRKGLTAITKNIPQNQPFMRRAAKAFHYANLDGDERIASYFQWLNFANVLDLLNEEVKNELGEYCPNEILLQSLQNLPGSTHTLNKMLYLEGKHFLADHNLNYTDKMGMTEGVEIRVPLLDPELIAFATTLPVHYKQRGRTGKWIFKKAMEGVLPKEVIYRPKTGFGAPLRSWLRNELKEMVDDVLSQESIRNRGLFDYARINRLRRLDEDGKLDAIYPIFSVICIELWCRIFIDQPLQN